VSSTVRIPDMAEKIRSREKNVGDGQTGLFLDMYFKTRSIAEAPVEKNCLAIKLSFLFALLAPARGNAGMDSLIERILDAYTGGTFGRWKDSF
jgi:hypothetical protein